MDRRSRQQGDLRRASSLLQRLGDVHLTGADLEAAVGIFDRMAQMARRAGDPEVLSWALAYQGMALCYNHDLQGGEVPLNEALKVEGASKAPRLFAALCLQNMRFIFGHHDESADTAPVVEALEAQGVDHPRVVGLLAVASLLPRWRGDLGCIEVLAQDPPSMTDLVVTQSFFWIRGMVEGESGHYDDALDTLMHTVATSSAADELMFKARALNTIGWIRGDLGDRAGCIEWNQRCLNFLREVDLPDEEIESNARLNLSESHLLVGDLTAAARELERVEEITRGKPLRGAWMLCRYSPQLHLLTAAFQLMSGNAASIGGRIAECAELAEASGSVKYLGKAARLRGRLRLAAGELDGAAAQAQLGARIATGMGHPPDQWRSHALLADIASARDDAERARFHIDIADQALASVEVALHDLDCRAGVAHMRASLVTPWRAATYTAAPAARRSAEIPRTSSGLRRACSAHPACAP